MSPEDKVTFIFTIPGTQAHEGKKRNSKKKPDIPPKPDTRLFRWKMIDGTEGKISEKYGWIEEEYYYNWDESHPPSKDDLALMEYVSLKQTLLVDKNILRLAGAGRTSTRLSSIFTN